MNAKQKQQADDEDDHQTEHAIYGRVLGTGDGATVGQALDYTLIRTGYRMVDPEALSDQARSFLNLPLPESQRRMGPYSVKTLLQVLLGNAWALRSDPISRQVWFELEGSGSAPAAPVAAVPEQTVQPAQPVVPQQSVANSDAQAMPAN